MKFSKSIIIVLVSLALLAVVVAVGLVFFYPKEPAKTAAAAPAVTTPAQTPSTTPVPNEFDPVEWTRNPTTPALQSPATKPAAGDQGFTVTLPPAEAAPATTVLPPSPGATFPGDTAPAPKAPANTPVSTPVATPKAAPEAAPSAKVAPAPKAKPAPAPKVVKTVKVTEFWVQVGSFKDRFQAENTAKLLETKGLKGTLTTATVAGNAVVRVRVGPYATDTEAKKYLATLTTEKEFSAAYVTKVNATRTAP